jgi:hypothetical protein
LVIDAPGLCSPSRRVVSKITNFSLDWVFMIYSVPNWSCSFFLKA